MAGKAFPACPPPGEDHTMPTYDRDELLAHADLRALFENLVGPGRGRGRSMTWPCPVRTHEQTGKSPPVTVDEGKNLWHCHGCGAGGTAIDLLVHALDLSVGGAIEELARQVGASPAATFDGQRRPRPRARHSEARRSSRPAVAPTARSELESYVSTCQAALWRPEGQGVLAWLEQRGLSHDVLRANRVGADPGPAVLERASGLPRRGRGAVFPVLDEVGRAVYCQVRYIDPRHEHRYDNPAEAAFGTNPRVAHLVHPAGAQGTPVVICEGFPDALSVAGAGMRAVAVLGAAYPDQKVAQAVVARYPNEAVAVGFDADDGGRKGSEVLGELLVSAGAKHRVWRLPVPDEGDLNDWARRAGPAFGDELRAAWSSLVPLGWRPATSAASLLGAFYAEQADQAGAVRIPTGIPELDLLLARGGWRPGLVLLGGMPGIGKSAFSLHCALHAAAAGHPVLYLSVEHGPHEMLGRLFCRATRRPISDYWNRDPAYLAAAQEVAGDYHLENLYLRTDAFLVEDHAGTVGRLREWASEVAEDTGRSPLIVVDYLQRLRPPESQSRSEPNRQISMAGLGLRQIARDLSAPVVAISSMNRQSYDRAPSLDAFKGSGDLEYDADACLLLRLAASSDEQAQQMAQSTSVVPVQLFLIGKNRYGPTNLDDPILLDFDRAYGGFRQRGGANSGRNGPPALYPVR